MIYSNICIIIIPRVEYLTECQCTFVQLDLHTLGLTRSYDLINVPIWFAYLGTDTHYYRPTSLVDLDINVLYVYDGI